MMMDQQQEQIPFSCSTFHPDPTNFCRDTDGKSVKITIDTGESIVFIGACNIQIIQGKVEVYGHEIEKESPKLSLYSPKTTSLLAINCLERETILILSSLPTDLQLSCPEHFAHESEHFIQGCSFVFSPLGNISTFYAYRDWESAKKSLSFTLPIVLVVGPRKVGKSTFCRWLCNSLLNRFEKVAFLNLDSSQTEFTPPGMLDIQIVQSPLLGPPFTHLALHSEKCFFHGSIEANDDPFSYLKFAFQLYQHYHDRLHSQQIPLIINTMGWTTGLGAEFLRHFIGKFALSDIVAFLENDSMVVSQLEYLKPPQSFKSLKSWNFKQHSEQQQMPNIAFCSTPSSNKFHLASPRMLREICCYFYFNGAFDGTFQFSLLSQKIPFSVPLRRVSSIEAVNCKLPEKRFLLNALNLSLVGLYHGNKCLGQGIIRGIDARAKILYIISPLDLEKIKQVDVLVKGKLEIPTFMLSQEPHVPYCSSSHSDDVLGQASLCGRPNLKRKKFNAPGKEKR